MDDDSNNPFHAMRTWLKQALATKTDSSLKDVIEEAIEEHAEKGEEKLKPEERVMLHNVLDFKDITVSDIMVPRTDIIAVPCEITLDQLKVHLVEQRHTRTPVYDETMDHMQGFLHVKDLIEMIAGDKPYNLKLIIRPLLYVPPSMRLMDLLAKMRSAGNHMAIVIDEHGGTDGLVTMENVMEELVGEMPDEHDEDEQPDNKLTRVGDASYEMSARMRIDRLEEKLGLNLATEEERTQFDTVGGLIFYKLGRVPTKAEHISIDGARFEILDADARRIQKVRLQLGS
jgi:magnesium and cobalt transporter